jgi:hypothetical protein
VDDASIARALTELADLLELGGESPLRVRAFRGPRAPTRRTTRFGAGQGEVLRAICKGSHVNHGQCVACKTMKRLLEDARAYVDGYVWHRVTGAGPFLQQVA